MPFEDDLDIFVDDFAQEVRADNPARTFRAIFDNAFFSPEIGETSLDTTQPRLTAKYADVFDFSEGETTVEVGTVTYDVESEPEPDGTGMAVVILAHQ